MPRIIKTPAHRREQSHILAAVTAEPHYMNMLKILALCLTANMTNNQSSIRILIEVLARDPVDKQALCTGFLPFYTNRIKNIQKAYHNSPKYSMYYGEKSRSR